MPLRKIFSNQNPSFRPKSPSAQKEKPRELVLHKNTATIRSRRGKIEVSCVLDPRSEDRLDIILAENNFVVRFPQGKKEEYSPGEAIKIPIPTQGGNVSNNYLRVSFKLDPDTREKVLVVEDHSPAGTRLEIRKGAIETVATPVYFGWKVITKRTAHPKQEIPAQELSDKEVCAGGDYFISPKVKDPELLRKVGQVFVLLDLASKKGGIEQGEKETRRAREFIKEVIRTYYNLLYSLLQKNPPSPQLRKQVLSQAFLEVLNQQEGKRGPAATLVWAIVVPQERGYSVEVFSWGNAVSRIYRRTDRKLLPLTKEAEGIVQTKEGPRTFTLFNLTPENVAQAIEEKWNTLTAFPGDSLFIASDGVLSIDPENPEESEINPGDDLILVEVPL